MAYWFLEGGRDNDVVLSTRIRLARNIKSLPFPGRMDGGSAQKAIETVKDAVLSGGSVIAKEFEYLAMDSITPADRQALVEKHLISPEMLNAGGWRGVLLHRDGHIAIMLNEEDHIRIQSIYGGFSLDEAWDMANKMDNLIEERVDYAFSERLGYLTSCPTNTGTGMRASVMLHLPAMAMTGNLNNLVSAAGKWGMAVRGLFGEGTKAQGDFYQLSNQVTLGVSEEETIAKLREVAGVVISSERDARGQLKESGNVALFDRIHRSLGTLTHAYSLSTGEMLQLLSDVRLGATSGILHDINLEALNKLIVVTGPAHILKASGKALQSQERDVARAQTVKAALAT